MTENCCILLKIIEIFQSLQQKSAVEEMKQNLAESGGKGVGL